MALDKFSEMEQLLVIPKQPIQTSAPDMKFKNIPTTALTDEDLLKSDVANPQKLI